MTAPGRVALVGSDTLTPALADVTSWLATGVEPTCVLVLVADRIAMDRIAMDRIAMDRIAMDRIAQQHGLDVRLVEVRARPHADASDRVAAVARAGLVLLAGDDPSAIVRAMRGSLLWTAIGDRWRGGAGLAGLGAGAVALGGYLPDVRHPVAGGTSGLGLVPSLRLIDRFDERTRLIPDSALAVLVAPGSVVVGIDAETALVAQAPADGGRWSFAARGRRSAWRVEPDRRHRVNAPLRLDVAT